MSSNLHGGKRDKQAFGRIGSWGTGPVGVEVPCSVVRFNVCHPEVFNTYINIQ